ncbi:MAG: hypothetical protein Q9222_005809 [Ikaeria aurantiellina]
MASPDQSINADLYGTTIALTVVASLSVVGRLFARKGSAAGLWWDDYTIFMALGNQGLDRHTTAANGPIGSGELTRFFELHYAILIMYFFSAMLIKTSLLLLYHRLFGVVRWFRWLLIAIWLVVALNFAVCLLVLIFECHPVSYFWDKSIKNGKCIDQNQFYLWSGVANLLIDFAVWSLTLPMVWRLQLSKRQKWTVSTVFLLGLLGLGDKSCTGFTVLDDQNGDQMGSVTAQASNTERWAAPSVQAGILKEQTIDQKIEYRM